MKHKVLSHAASLYLLILAPSLLLVPEPGNAQPVNDAFADGQSLSGSTGTTYQIAVDGWGGDTGTVTLNWTQTAQELPDLIIWGPSISPKIETVTFSPSSCAVVEGMVQAGTRKLLRFSTETRNQGAADIYLGNPATNPQFVYAPCHGHYHFNNYANYRLLDNSGQQVATGLKIGFCLLDSVRWDANAP